VTRWVSLTLRGRGGVALLRGVGCFVVWGVGYLCSARFWVGALGWVFVLVGAVPEQT
jgi:hypothetical protein